MTQTRATALLLTAAVVAAALAGCSSSGNGKGAPSVSHGSDPASSAAAGAGAAASSSAASGPQYYVSVGDSYAAGYQPTSAKAGRTTRNGFAYQLLALAQAKGYHLSLVNFGCAGATTVSVLHSPGCARSYLGPGASSYAPKTQAAAAEAFLSAHRGHIGLITVSIGGNDILPCGAASSPTACVSSALSKVTTNLAMLLTGLRAAAGTAVVIVGITYPDVLLAGSLSKNAQARTLAQLSVPAFKELVNPALQRTYQAAGAKFADVTAATGAYGSMTATTTLAGYGTVPVPVANICTLTYMCQYDDIHPRTTGYALIAKLVLALLPSR